MNHNNFGDPVTSPWSHDKIDGSKLKYPET